MDGSVLGHLAAIDSKPMPYQPRAEWVFRIFAERAAAELRRLRADARRGYENTRRSYRIKADVSDEVLQELVQFGPSYSPVFDTVTNGTSISVTAERKQEG